MSEPSWTDAARWRGYVEGDACPFCTAGPRGVIARLAFSDVTMDESVSIRGYCCLIPRTHAVELHDLGEDDAFAFMKDVQTAARVIQEATGAIKLNYEIHGNVIPHIHMHIIPRYPGDAIEVTGKNFAGITGAAYGPGEFDEVRGRIREALSQ